MLRLPVVGQGRLEDVVVGSSLCSRCRYSPAGCCAAPPRMDWSDVARVVRHGGRDWLIAQIAARKLRPFEHGLSLRRVKGRVAPDPSAPRVKKCVFHGPAGCTIPDTHRPATCNFYVCHDAIDDGDTCAPGAGQAALRLHDTLVARFTKWDAELHARIARTWPDGVVFDAAFLDWLSTELASLSC